jgi:hypothetical protein
MENVLSLLLSLSDRLIGFVPGWLLRRFHPLPKLAHRVVIHSVGTGLTSTPRQGSPFSSLASSLWYATLYRSLSRCRV